MSLKFRGGLVSATLTLAAIAIVGCGGGTTETTEETPAADGETTEETTTADSGSDAPAEGVLGECELVQDVLDEDFNNGFGASLSGDSGEIKADDSVIAASVAAGSAADGMEDAQEEAQEVVDGLTAIEVTDTELAGYKDAYLAKLDEMIPELETAAAYYASLEEAIDADSPTAEQATLLEEAPTRTDELAEVFDTFNDDLEDIDEDVFDYCLDAELDAEFPDN
jgi:hypothetical protein